MKNGSEKNLCIYHVHDGLSQGLSHYAGASRAAVLYALNPSAPLRVYDPQNLLRGHEPKLQEIYLDSEIWRTNMVHQNSTGDENLPLTGMISYGARSNSLFYQMWLTEHHPDMCATGPSVRWLEHASWLLSQDLAAGGPPLGTSSYVLGEYAIHAVRDHIVDERNRLTGADTKLRVYPTLDAILEISKTKEEGRWARGKLAFVEPSLLATVDLPVRFLAYERPILNNYKHVRKILSAVESSERVLICDGTEIVGVNNNGQLPKGCIIADFKGSHGFVKLDDQPVCSFYDGSYHSSTRKANLVQLEEAFLENNLEMEQSHGLFKIVKKIVHLAQDRKHGATLILDPQPAGTEIAGQHLESAVDLREEEMLDLAIALAKVDGALHIGQDMRLYAFACLMDGRSVLGENRARGARFNSALRFTAEHEDLIVVVVSSDRPVSIIQGGIELTAACSLNPVTSCSQQPPTLAAWIEE